MKLYYALPSTYSQKVLIAFQEKQLSFTPEMVDFSSEEGREAYRKIYPLGKIPLLILDDDYRIPESTIIIEYLDKQSENGAQLISSDPEIARKTRFLDRMFDLYLNNSVSAIFFEQMKPENERNEKLLETSRKNIDIMYGFMDKGLSEKNEWINSDGFSMADCSAVGALFYARDLHPFSKHSNISAYAERLMSHPSVKAVFDQVIPALKELNS